MPEKDYLLERGNRPTAATRPAAIASQQLTAAASQQLTAAASQQIGHSVATARDRSVDETARGRNADATAHGRSVAASAAASADTVVIV